MVNILELKIFIPIVCGAVIVFGFIIVLLACIIYCVYRKCCKRRTDYMLVGQSDQSRNTIVDLRGNHEVGLIDAIQRQTVREEIERKEAALLSCQFYLRSVPDLLFECHLPDIGSRMSKNWFIAQQIGRTTKTLLTMLPVRQQCRLNLQEDKYTLKKLINSLEHMNIHQIHSIDYIPERRLVIVIEPFHSRGSLKDLIYQTTPNLSWSTKYSVRRNGLSWKQVQSFGRQILHSVLFLYHLGLKPLGQIQSGNIYLDRGIIKLSGYESQLLGYKPRINGLVKDYKNRIDSAMFGHLIYELSSGHELSTSKPSERELAAMKYSELREVLKFIFYNEERQVPSIEEILKHPFFCDQNSPGMDHWSYKGIRFDDDMKRLLTKSRKGTRITNSKKRPKSNTSRYPIFQQPGSSTLPTIVQSPTNNEPFIKPISNDKGNRKQHKTKNKQQDRSVLLGDICKGTSLRKTVTNDRSAPML